MVSTTYYYSLQLKHTELSTVLKTGVIPIVSQCYEYYITLSTSEYNSYTCPSSVMVYSAMACCNNPRKACYLIGRRSDVSFEGIASPAAKNLNMRLWQIG